jgi:hypothetical protein
MKVASVAAGEIHQPTAHIDFQTTAKQIQLSSVSSP